MLNYGAVVGALSDDVLYATRDNILDAFVEKVRDFTSLIIFGVPKRASELRWQIPNQFLCRTLRALKKAWLRG